MTMYTSFIRPSLEYGNIVWCNCTAEEEENLESLQRRAAKLITGGIIRTNTANLYCELGLETLKTRRERNIALFMHKVVNDQVPSYLSDLKPQQREQEHGYNLRNSSSRTIPKCRLTKYQMSCFPLGVKIWNSLDPDLQNTHTFEAFKNLLSKSIPKDNSLFQIGSRQETIIMARLRMKCSNLAADLYDLNIVESAQCRCGHDYEDAIHYFFVCPLYTRPRAALHAAIIGLAPFTLRTLLYGNHELNLTENSSIIQQTILFINNSKRFS